MPNIYSVGGNLVSKTEYNKANGIKQDKTVVAPKVEKEVVKKVKKSANKK